VLVSELDGRLVVLNPHLHDGVPLVEAARRAGVPRRTATRWLAAYQANGLEGLRRLDRADRGRRRLPQEMIEGMARRQQYCREVRTRHPVGLSTVAISGSVSVFVMPGAEASCCGAVSWPSVGRSHGHQRAVS